MFTNTWNPFDDATKSRRPASVDAKMTIKQSLDVIMPKVDFLLKMDLGVRILDVPEVIAKLNTPNTRIYGEM